MIERWVSIRGPTGRTSTGEVVKDFLQSLGIVVKLGREQLGVVREILAAVQEVVSAGTKLQWC